MFAKQAVDAKDNNDTSRANHKEYLTNMLRGQALLMKMEKVCSLR